MLYEVPGFKVGMATYELDAALSGILPAEVRQRLERALSLMRESQAWWAAWCAYPYLRR